MINREPITSLRNSQPQATMGVLTDTELVLVGAAQGKRVLHSLLLPPEARQLNGLLEYLWQEGLAAVWVMPATMLSHSVTCASLEQESSQWVVLARPGSPEPTHPSCVLVWPKSSSPRQGRRLTLAFPEHAGWDWRLPDARSLLATVTYLDQVLARHIIDTPELTARQLLADLTIDQPASQLRSSPVDLAALSSGEESPISRMEHAQNFVWMRPLTLVEQRQKYLHKYSYFFRHLQSCLEVQLGAGEPQYSSTGRAFDGVLPGIWRVQAQRGGSVFDGKLLPGYPDEGWMSTPEVTCCRDIGYHVDVKEGYYWPQSHNVLKGWATTLWQVAERLHTSPQFRHAQARTNASHTIKTLAQLGLSILAQDKMAGGWSRLDWWMQIVGRSRALLFAQLVNFVRKGTMPVLMDWDAFWVVSNDPNPLTAVPGLITAPKWNGYSAGYEVPLPLTAEVRDAFRGGQPADQVVKMLDSLAGEGFAPQIP